MMILHLLKLGTLLYLGWGVTAILVVLGFAVSDLRNSRPAPARTSQRIDVALTPTPED